MRILVESDVHSFEDGLKSKLKDIVAHPERVYEALKWLDVFSLYEPFVADADTPPRTLLDAFCALLSRKLVFEKDERDFVLLTHRFKIAFPRSNEKNTGSNSLEEANNDVKHSELEFARTVQEHTCSLALYGDQPAASDSNIRAFSAMAKTVGYPVALAAELLLHAPRPSSDMDTTSDAWIPMGVILPIHKAIYQPILKGCPRLGIHFHESISKTPTLFH
jgi:saccharopine dehydrogenase (NADP+, L-glutamate forming)